MPRKFGVSTYFQGQSGLPKLADFANLFGMEVSIHHVETHLTKLIELAEHGEEVVIARAGQAVVKMVPVPAKPTRRMIGSARGKIWVFDDTSSPEINKAIEEFLNNSPQSSDEEQ
ncbi:MAG TPA: type II toxin-antitoxin system Phd/YefM family antitoxin [Silvibacterium sp.]|nr:type II toxin-antitoxin system Phd/YefM family antitoxin [Silvibacterium sp.]